jgi:hypothetical protein
MMITGEENQVIRMKALALPLQIARQNIITRSFVATLVAEEEHDLRWITAMNRR